MTDHDDGAKPQLAVTNRGTCPRWSEEIRPTAPAVGKSEKENDMNDEWASHKAYVMGIIGNPYVWIVRCDQCRWLEEAVGPWVDVEAARRQAEAHACDPDIEEKAAEHAALWADPNYDELNDKELQGHIDTWLIWSHEFARLRDEAADSGEGERLQRLIGRSHVRATQGIREQRRREDRVLRDTERGEHSQCEREDGGQA